MNNQILIACLSGILTVGLAPSSAAQALVVGRSLPLTGPLKTVGEFKRDGGDAYIYTVNTSGGVNGKKIEVVTLDDAYNADSTVSNLRKISADHKPVAFMNLLRLPALGNAIALLDELKISVVGISSATDLLRTQFNSYGFPVRAGFVDEARKLVQHVKVIGLSNIVLVYQDVPLGLNLKSRTKAALKEASLETTTLKLDAAALEINTVAREVAQARPQAVFLGLLTPAAVAMIAELKRLSYNGALYTFSSTDASVIAKQLGKDAVGLAIAQVVPVPNGPRVRIAAEYLQAARNLGRGVAGPLGLEAYIEAKVLVEGLRRAGANPTAASVVKSLETLHDFDLGGFYVSYRPGAHIGSLFVEVDVISGKGELVR
jgi:branched-chain amino acid transport system substrate-binding protein